jgi:hypothetical protein
MMSFLKAAVTLGSKVLSKTRPLLATLTVSVVTPPEPALEPRALKISGIAVSPALAGLSPPAATPRLGFAPPSDRATKGPVRIRLAAFWNTPLESLGGRFAVAGWLRVCPTVVLLATNDEGVPSGPTHRPASVPALAGVETKVKSEPSGAK